MAKQELQVQQGKIYKKFSEVKKKSKKQILPFQKIIFKLTMGLTIFMFWIIYVY